MAAGWVELIGAALALALVVEGALPFLNPQAWRRVMERALQLHDGQIRFFGLLCLAAGGLFLWLATS